MADDVGDILGVQQPGTPVSRTPRSKSAAKELKSPLMMNVSGVFSPQISGLKEKRIVQQKVQRWGWVGFTCPVRDDDFVFHHWAPVDGNNENELATSNFDSLHQKRIKVFQYNNIEYNTLIVQLPNSMESNYDRSTLNDKYLWTRQETDQLFLLCKSYDLRFVVIHDHFQSCRETGEVPTIEQMKNRYYTVARILLESRAAKKNQLNKIDKHPLIVANYDYGLEVRRKSQIESVIFNRSAESEQRENEIKEKLKRIDEIKKRRAEEEKKERLAQKKREKKEQDTQKKLERERKKQERLKKLEEQRLANAQNPSEATTIVIEETSSIETTSDKISSARKPPRTPRRKAQKPKSDATISSEPVIPQKYVDLDLVDEGMVSSTSFSSENTISDVTRKLKSGVHTRSDLMLACAAPDQADRMEYILREIALLRPMPTLRIHQVMDEMRERVTEILELENKLKKIEKKAASSGGSKKRDADFTPDGKRRKSTSSSSSSSRPKKKQKNS
jgi:hypothetical protein